MYQCLKEAEKGGYGVGAFNVNNMEQIQGIMKAARELESPVILQASRGALKYTDLTYLKYLVQAAVEANPEIPVVLHLDHGDSLETVKTAIRLGFTSVMIDASHHDFETNVRISREVVEYAHEFGVSVEAELGTLGGIEEDVAGTVQLTDPDQAEEFVARVGCDSLAVAIGTSHGAYKFKGEPKLALDLVQEISRRVQIPLVLHGASSVPKELVDAVNAYGGSIEQSSGVPVEGTKEPIRYGVRKINVDTDIRLAMTGAVRKTLFEAPEKFDPRDYLGPAREAVYRLVAQRMKDFGSAGHARDYTPITLEDMKAHYKRA